MRRGAFFGKGSDIFSWEVRCPSFGRRDIFFERHF